jgi:hypothetical protein
VDGGGADVPVYEDEVTALRAMLSAARPGDVVAITALAQRPEVFAMLDREGATRPTPARVRQLVRRARARPTVRRRAG